MDGENSQKTGDLAIVDKVARLCRTSPPAMLISRFAACRSGCYYEGLPALLILMPAHFPANDSIIQENFDQHSALLLVTKILRGTVPRPRYRSPSPR
jgi:hypothetical protein